MGEKWNGLIAGAARYDADGRWDIEIADGRIAKVEPSLPGRAAAAGEVLHAEGALLLPGLVETHIHLDKAFLSNRMPRPAGSVAEAIAMTAELKSSYTAEDITARSELALDRASRFGVTRLRAHVEIDPIIGLMSLESALDIRRRYADKIGIQLVAFPQEGIFSRPGTDRLLREAMRSGVDAIGGVPYNDRDSREHLEFVFRLAEEWGSPIDLHLDFSDDPGAMAIADVVELTRTFGMRNRVAVGHLTALGSAEPEVAQRLANEMAEAGISVFALPATDLYLNGRADAARPRRGLTPVRTLLDAGVNVCFGTNNMRNAFTPFGTGDPLDIGLLLAQTTYMGSREDAAVVVGMCTERAAEALGMADYGIKTGLEAELVLIEGAPTPSDALYDRPRERTVWRNGIKL